jgi:predicted Zn-dependent peptidase
VRPALAVLLLAVALIPGARAGPGELGLDTEVLRLDNGMTLLLVDRPASGFVAAGWVARVGSADDPAGRTGLSHLLEHMMFKGTRTVGTTDVERELPLIAEQDESEARLRRLRVLASQSSGAAGEALAREIADAEERLRRAIEQHRSLLVPDEYDRIYGRAGATSINAFTTPDMTTYFVSVPANRLELWFWMESDRLLAPVFRGLHGEREIVAEERRRRETTPTGPFSAQLEAQFWQAHPYRWPRLGWPADVESATTGDVQRHFQAWYTPGNLTAALVGHFDRRQAADLARRYFGRLPAAPAPVRSSPPEPGQRAEMRMLARCDCPPQVELRYHTVPFLHADADALDVLAALLNGRAGRLYAALVAGAGGASQAAAEQSSLARAGYFAIRAQAAQPDVPPEQLEQGWYGVLSRLQEEPVPPGELERVKNGMVADALRRLEDPFYLMVQLLTYAGHGDWRYLREQPRRIQAVTAADLQRVAQTYFRPTGRTVALYRRAAAKGQDGATGR